MSNEITNVLDHAVDKDRVYVHSTKKNLETKNRKKTVERKTTYDSKSKNHGEIYLSRIATSFEVISLALSRLIEDKDLSETYTRPLSLCKGLCDVESASIRDVLSSSSKD